MEFITAGIIASLWFGILTSISPCPMATSVAAISFIGKKAGSVRAVIFSGFSYTVGRALAYIIIALLIVASLLSIPELARGLQKYINIALGPVLIIIGIILLDFIKLNIGRGFGISDKFRDYLLDKGYAGSMLLGFVFALSFCPVSAGLFFGSLIPLAVKFESPFFFRWFMVSELLYPL
jgi:cytochrome c-type biogenesis protein